MIGILFLVCNSIFCADYEAVNQELRRAVLTNDKGLFNSTWESFYTDYDSMPGLENPFENPNGLISSQITKIERIYSFNDYFCKDQQGCILYTPNLLEQQKLRLVCQQWKKMIDDNPSTIHLESYFKLLRNPRPGHTHSKNKIRVLNGAVYKKEYSLVEALLQSLEFEKIVDAFEKSFPYKYHMWYFLKNYPDKELIEYQQMKEIFKKYNFYENDCDIFASENATVDRLIIESFLGNTRAIQENIALLEKDLAQIGNIELNTQAQDSISHVFTIFMNYDDLENIKALINAIKNMKFLTNTKSKYLLESKFHEFCLKAHSFEQLEVLDILLASGVNVNNVTYSDRILGTIKDHLLLQFGGGRDKEYIVAVNTLLDKHGVMTLKALWISRIPTIMATAIALMGIFTFFYYLNIYKGYNNEYIKNFNDR